MGLFSSGLGGGNVVTSILLDMTLVAGQPDENGIASLRLNEDTILESYLRAGEYDEAEKMLRERLNRRTSVRDTLWLGRAQEGSGQAEAASASVQEVIQRWSGADPASPEVKVLNSLSERVG